MGLWSLRDAACFLHRGGRTHLCLSVWEGRRQAEGTAAVLDPRQAPVPSCGRGVCRAPFMPIRLFWVSPGQGCRSPAAFCPGGCRPGVREGVLSSVSPAPAAELHLCGAGGVCSPSPLPSSAVCQVPGCGGAPRGAGVRGKDRHPLSMVRIPLSVIHKGVPMWKLCWLGSRDPGVRVLDSRGSKSAKTQQL